MKYKNYLFLLLSFAASVSARAQESPCSAATQTLDANNVSASVYNNGMLFWNGRGNEYRVPKAGRAHAIFATSLWIGGLVGGELRMAATTYGPAEFRPGPYLETGYECADFNRIYKVSREDVLAFEAGLAPTDDIVDWPWELGAPVLDGDGNPDNYDLSAGDRPAPIGDQVVWWIMNDGGEHRTMRTAPLGMEVRVTASSFSRNTVEQFYRAAPVAEHLDHSTFYRFQLRYLGDEPLEDAYVGLHVDANLGDGSDDYVGSDSVLGLGFFYNGDDFDAGLDGYGEQPPALGLNFMQGLAAPAGDGIDNDRDGLVDEDGERLQMTALVAWRSDFGVYGEVRNAQGAYYRLRGLWLDGSPITEGCNGFGPITDQCGDTLATPATTFMYSGEPPEYWSEERIDFRGNRNLPSHKRFVMAMGPVTMQSGEEEDFILGIVWARTINRIASVRILKEADLQLQGLVREGLLEPEDAWFEIPKQVQQNLPSVPQETWYVLGQNRPNPFRSSTVIPYELWVQARVQIFVYDLLGREVTHLEQGVRAPGPHEAVFDGGSLPPGVYFYRMHLLSETVAGRMLLLR